MKKLMALLLLLVACSGGGGDSPTNGGGDSPTIGGEDSPTNAPPRMDPDVGKDIDVVIIDEPPVQIEFDFLSPIGADPFEGGIFGSFPINQIVSGGPPKDGIPALTNPYFTSSTPTWLSPDDFILGFVWNGEAKAYPHNIGWWHEIINDVVGELPITITFCPLTGTGLAFSAANAYGEQFELGVSGLLYNTNLIMFDRRDRDTLYPQMYFTGISGPRKTESLRLLPIVETTWRMWKQLYPNSTVISQGTYNQSQYVQYPYFNYRTDNEFFLFPVSPSLSLNSNSYSTLFDAKDRVLGLRIDGSAKAYPFVSMGEQAVINDDVDGYEVLILWSKDGQLAIPYERTVDGQLLSFDMFDDSVTPFTIQDRETGTIWNVIGEAISGELQGATLRQIPAHNSMWFAWVTFWRETEVWSE